MLEERIRMEAWSCALMTSKSKMMHATLYQGMNSEQY